MTQKLQGSSQEVANNFLGLEFWRPGITISGTVQRKFESSNGECYAVQLDDPIEIESTETDEIALGNLKGLHMAIQAAGAADLQVGDRIKLSCTDLQPTVKGNPRIDFEIKILRD